MTRARDVLLSIDIAVEMHAHNPLLFARLLATDEDCYVAALVYLRSRRGIPTPPWWCSGSFLPKRNARRAAGQRQRQARQAQRRKARR